VDEERSRKSEGNFAADASNKQLRRLADLKQHYRRDLDAELQSEHISCQSFEAKLQEATGIMSEEELAPLIERLQQMKKAFKVNATTLAGSEVSVEASRVNTIAQLKDIIAAELGIQAYRIALSSEGGEVLPDAQTLEEQGIYGTGSQVFLIVRDQQKFREMSHEEFVALLKSKRLHPSHIDVVRTKCFDDIAFRQQYIPKLEAMEKEEERHRERKEHLRRRQELIKAEIDEVIGTGGDASALLTARLMEAETQCQTLADEARAIKEDAQRDLDEALPALEAAVTSLNRLSKQHICELKCLAQPPQLVTVVGEALCIMFGEKPSWDCARKLLNNPRLLDMMLSYEKDDIDPATIKRVERYIARDDFYPANVQMASVAAASICSWVRAMHTYDRICKIVMPKRQALLNAQELLEEALLELKTLREGLARLPGRLS
jgi:hypothetical protein